MSNLSELLPAGAGAKSADFVASGTLGSGVTVALKADGTVTAVAETSYSQSVGSETTYAAIGGEYNAIVDIGGSKFAIAYRRNDNKDIYTVIGTVSGTTLTFGTPVLTFDTSQTTEDPVIAYDAASGKVVVACSFNYGEDALCVVGTVSGTSITFGSSVNFHSGTDVLYLAMVYDSINQKIVIGYCNKSVGNSGYAVVGTVSGTSISFGTPVQFASASSQYIRGTFDPDQGSVFFTFRDGGSSNYPTAIVGQVSGTSISFGTEVVMRSATGGSYGAPATYDTSAQKIVVTYTAGSNLEYIQAGTISGTSVSFGSAQELNSGLNTDYPWPAYNPLSESTLVVYKNTTDNGYGYAKEVTLSGTTFTLGTQFLINNTNDNNYCTVAYVSGSSGLVYSNYVDSVAYMEATAITLAYTVLNSADFIGISDAAIADTATGAVIVKGGVSANVTGLTIGSDYYVQDDGSISSPTGAYPYNISGGVYNSVSLVVSDNLMSIFFKPDGTKLYAIGYTNDTVYEYGLSTAFDLSTATLNGNTKSIAAQSGVTPSLVFKTDGTKMYALSSADEVFQYSLSTAWDVSSASYDSKSLTVSSQDADSSGIWFKSDGTEMYMCGYTNDSIFQYDLSTPWDVSTGAYASISFNMSATSTQPRNMYFNSTGTILFLADTLNPDKVFKFVLSTAWDITTISFSSSLDVSAQAAKAVDVVLNADGTKMYVADSENTNTIYQYALNGSTSSVPAGRALSSTSILLEG